MTVRVRSIPEFVALLTERGCEVDPKQVRIAKRFESVTHRSDLTMCSLIASAWIGEVLYELCEPIGLAKPGNATDTNIVRLDLARLELDEQCEALGLEVAGGVFQDVR